jgi:hypothetical protein
MWLYYFCICILHILFIVMAAMLISWWVFKPNLKGDHPSQVCLNRLQLYIISEKEICILIEYVVLFFSQWKHKKVYILIMKNFLTLIFSRIFSCRCSVKIVQSSPINDGSCPKMYISSMTKVACVDLHVYIVLVLRSPKNCILNVNLI